MAPIDLFDPKSQRSLPLWLPALCVVLVVARIVLALRS
jgi:hypothetical protein